VWICWPQLQVAMGIPLCTESPKFVDCSCLGLFFSWAQGSARVRWFPVRAYFCPRWRSVGLRLIQKPCSLLTVWMVLVVDDLYSIAFHSGLSHMILKTRYRNSTTKKLLINSKGHQILALANILLMWVYHTMFQHLRIFCIISDTNFFSIFFVRLCNVVHGTFEMEKEVEFHMK